MRRSIHALLGWEPPAASRDVPTGALRFGCEAGGRRARSRPGRAASDAAVAAATQEMPGSVRAAARAGRSGRT